MTLTDELKQFLRNNHTWAKKHLGQNFLIDEFALEDIADAAQLKPDDDVIEVGPGTGFLTHKILPGIRHLTAVEYDEFLVKTLRLDFLTSKNIDIVHSDILKFNIADYTLRHPRYKVVANIPYYITSPILKLFLNAATRPELMVLLVQKEVAEKICGIGGKTILTVETSVFAEPEILRTIPRGSFYPAPKVDSAILRLRVRPEPLVPSGDMKDFLRMVGFGYSQKRKKLSNGLGAGLHIKPEVVRLYLSGAQINPDVRAEDLTVDDWKRLHKILTEVK